MTDLFDQILLENYGILQRQRDATREFEEAVVGAAKEGIDALRQVAREWAEDVFSQLHPAILCPKRLESAASKSTAVPISPSPQPQAKGTRTSSRRALAVQAVLEALRQSPRISKHSVSGAASRCLELRGESLTRAALDKYLNQRDFLIDVCIQFLATLAPQEQAQFVKDRIDLQIKLRRFPIYPHLCISPNKRLIEYLLYKQSLASKT